MQGITYHHGIIKVCFSSFSYPLVSLPQYSYPILVTPPPVSAFFMSPVPFYLLSAFSDHLFLSFMSWSLL